MKQLLETFALPPVSFLYVAILGLILARWRRRMGHVLICIGLVALTVLSLPAVGGCLILSLEQNLPVTPPLTRCLRRS